jgi:hypothetical protein
MNEISKNKKDNEIKSVIEKAKTKNLTFEYSLDLETKVILFFKKDNVNICLLIKFDIYGNRIDKVELTKYIRTDYFDEVESDIDNIIEDEVSAEDALKLQKIPLNNPKSFIDYIISNIDPKVFNEVSKEHKKEANRLYHLIGLTVNSMYPIKEVADYILKGAISGKNQFFLKNTISRAIDYCKKDFRSDFSVEQLQKLLKEVM